jgi:hypothetical protein
LYTTAESVIVEEKPEPETESIYVVRILSPEKQDEFEGLRRAIQEAVEVEIDELAADLATTDDAHIRSRVAGRPLDAMTP